MDDKGPARKTSGRAALCVGVLAALSSTAHAARLDYQLEGELLHSDNITQSETGEIDETVVIPRVRFDLTHEGPDLMVRARGLVEYRNYLDDSFSNEARGNFAGQLNWSLIPDRFALLLEDYLTEEPIDFRDSNNPGNVQQVNVLVAGATLKARLADSTHAQLDLRAADSRAEETDGFDGNRYSAAASVEREFTPNTRASLNLVGTEVDFDEAPNVTDYTRQDGFVRYHHQLKDINILVDLGRSRIKPDDGGNRSSTTLARTIVSWQAAARSDLRLRSRHEFSDAVQDLIVRHGDLSEALIPELAEPGLLVSSGIYRQRYYDLQFRHRGDRFTWRVRPSYQRVRYLGDSLGDRNARGATLQVDYRAHPRLTFSAQASGRNREYLLQPREDRDRTYSLGAEYRSSRHLSWRAEAVHAKRDSTALGSSFSENHLRFTVIWTR